MNFLEALKFAVDNGSDIYIRPVSERGQGIAYFVNERGNVEVVPLNRRSLRHFEDFLGEWEIVSSKDLDAEIDTDSMEKNQ